MRNCPVCSSPSNAILFVTALHQSIVCCDFCGMVYAEGTPDVDYANDSIYTCEETYQRQNDHYNIIVQNIRDNVYVPSVAPVLDVGCALGGQIKAFEKANFKDVSGISLSAGEVARCTEQGLEAFVANLSDKPPRPFSLVVVSHVLEHVPDVQGFLQNLYKWLSQDGYVYIEVPNALRYAECFKSVCQGFNLEHINHFSLSHLREALTRTGFDCIRCGTYDTPTETDVVYPCLWVIAKPRYTAKGLQSAVIRYRDKLIPQLDFVVDKLKKDLKGVKLYAVWGLGQTTHMLVYSGALDPQRITKITDSNPVFWNKDFYKQLDTSSLADFRFVNDNVPIVVCSQTRQEEIVAKIQSMGLTNKLILLEK